MIIILIISIIIILIHKTVKTNDKIRRFGVVMTPLSRKNVFDHANVSRCLIKKGGKKFDCLQLVYEMLSQALTCNQTLFVQKYFHNLRTLLC